MIFPTIPKLKLVIINYARCFKSIDLLLNDINILMLTMYNILFSK